MTTSAINRIRKFKAKLDPKVRGKLYDLQKECMVRKETKATIDLVEIEKWVKQIVDGQPIIYIPYYYTFAKQIYKLVNKFQSQTLINELKILDDIWESRGLDQDLLIEIKNHYVPEYPGICFFKLDVSHLDGPCVLA